MIKMIESIKDKELKLTISFDSIIEQYNTNIIDRKELMSIHNNIVKTVINFLSQYVFITEYISLNSVSDKNIELKINYNNKLPFNTKYDFEKELNRFMELLLPISIVDKLGYPFVEYM